MKNAALMLSMIFALCACESKEQPKEKAKPTVTKAKPEAKTPPPAPKAADKPQDAKPAPIDPNSPRERFETLLKRGEKQFDSVYREREAILTKLDRIKGLSAEEKRAIAPVVQKVTMFGAGDDAEELADAPERICKLIAEVRIPAEKLITSGQEHLVKLRNQEREFEAAQDAGGTVYQKQWDKLDKEITRWSGPVKVGKFGLMLVKSVLDEAYVLAEWGPRATQQALGKCLSELKPLELGLAQQRLEEVIERTKVYWR